MLRQSNAKRGFTLVEVLLVMGILGIITGLAIPFYQSFQISSELDNVTQGLVQAIRSTQAKAMSSKGLSSHGVHFNINQYIIFEGNIYNSADINNEVFEFANTIDIISSGSNDIVFSAGEGLPDSQPTITIISSNGESNNIILNNFGVVNVN